MFYVAFVFVALCLRASNGTGIGSCSWCNNNRNPANVLQQATDIVTFSPTGNRLQYDVGGTVESVRFGNNPNQQQNAPRGRTMLLMPNVDVEDIHFEKKGTCKGTEKQYALHQIVSMSINPNTICQDKIADTTKTYRVSGSCKKVGTMDVFFLDPCGVFEAVNKIPNPEIPLPNQQQELTPAVKATLAVRTRRANIIKPKTINEDAMTKEQQIGKEVDEATDFLIAATKDNKKPHLFARANLVVKGMKLQSWRRVATFLKQFRELAYEIKFYVSTAAEVRNRHRQKLLQFANNNQNDEALRNLAMVYYCWGPSHFKHKNGGTETLDSNGKVYKFSKSQEGDVIAINEMHYLNYKDDADALFEYYRMLFDLLYGVRKRDNQDLDDGQKYANLIAERFKTKPTYFLFRFAAAITETVGYLDRRMVARFNNWVRKSRDIAQQKNWIQPPLAELQDKNAKFTQLNPFIKEANCNTKFHLVGNVRLGVNPFDKIVPSAPLDESSNSNPNQPVPSAPFLDEMNGNNENTNNQPIPSAPLRPNVPRNRAPRAPRDPLVRTALQGNPITRPRTFE